MKGKEVSRFELKEWKEIEFQVMRVRKIRMKKRSWKRILIRK